VNSKNDILWSDDYYSCCHGVICMNNFSMTLPNVERELKSSGEADSRTVLGFEN